MHACTDPEVGGGRPPEKITKKDFLAILVRIHWKITKLPNQNWRVDDGPLMLAFELTKTNQNKQKEKVIKLDHLWQNFLDPRMALAIKYVFK